MKKQLLIIGIVVAIVICILAAGCTGTVTDQKQTAQTTPALTPQVTETTPVVETVTTQEITDPQINESVSSEQIETDNVATNTSKSKYVPTENDLKAAAIAEEYVKAEGYLSSNKEINQWTWGEISTYLDLGEDWNSGKSAFGLKESEILYGVYHCGIDWKQVSIDYVNEVLNRIPTVTRSQLYLNLDDEKSKAYRESSEGIYINELGATTMPKELLIYGIENCGVDWGEHLVKHIEALQRYNGGVALIKDDIREKLLKGGYSDEEVDYAINHANVEWGPSFSDMFE